MIIVHVITRLIRGGADENTLLCCNEQASEGHDVHLVVGKEVSTKMTERLHPLVKLHVVSTLIRPLRVREDFSAFFAIRRIIRKLQPDIVHTHTSKAGFLGRAAAIFSGAGAIVHGVHILPFLNVSFAERIIYWTAEFLLVPVTNFYASVSQGMMDACIRAKIGGRQKHAVVKSGMDVLKFMTATAISDTEINEIEASSPVGPNSLVLLMVAAFEPRKRISEFLDVFAEVHAECPEAVLVLLGEGEERTHILEKIAILQLHGSVLTVGFRSDVERWIKRADICVLSSEREGLPRVIVQYALGAKPIVSTALPGIDVIVKEGKNGFLVGLNEVPAMKDHLLKLLSNSGMRADFGSFSGQLDLSAWGVTYMVRQLDKIYLDVLQPGG